MRTLTNLTATLSDAALCEAPCHHHTVIDRAIGPGFVRAVALGPEGLIISAPGVALGIPLAELMALAEQLDPAFKPPPATGP